MQSRPKLGEWLEGNDNNNNKTTTATESFLSSFLFILKRLALNFRNAFLVAVRYFYKNLAQQIAATMSARAFLKSALIALFSRTMRADRG